MLIQYNKTHHILQNTSNNIKNTWINNKIKVLTRVLMVWWCDKQTHIRKSFKVKGKYIKCPSDWERNYIRDWQWITIDNIGETNVNNEKLEG